MKKEDWLAAIQKLKKINDISPGYEDTGDKLASVNQQATRIYYKQGLDLEEQEDWKGAVLAYKSVLDINPGYQDAARRYEEARGKDNIHYYVKEGAIAAAARPPKWERAILLYEKAKEYDPDNKEVEKRLKSFRENAAQSFFDGAIKDTQQGKLYEAARKLELAKTYKPSMQDAPLFKEFMTNRFGMKLIERGERYAEKGQVGKRLISPIRRLKPLIRITKASSSRSRRPRITSRRESGSPSPFSTSRAPARARTPGKSWPTS